MTPRTHVIEAFHHRAPAVLPYQWDIGQDLVLWGGGPSQSLIPFGKPGEIRACFQRLRDVLGEGGGYLCAPSKTIMADTPLDNAIATIEGVVGHPLAVDTGECSAASREHNA